MALIKKVQSKITSLQEAKELVKKKRTLTWVELGEVLTLAIEQGEEKNGWLSFAEDLTRGVVRLR